MSVFKPVGQHSSRSDDVRDVDLAEGMMSCQSEVAVLPRDLVL